MAAATSLEWRRRFPTRVVRSLAWYLLAAGTIIAVVWLLFGAEPRRLPSGEANPLALLPLLTTILAGLGALPLVAALVRRPRVGADHYALYLRPGTGRTLLLPWATVTEITAATAAGRPFLLVALRPAGSQPGDRPRWFDQAALRSAASMAAGFDLAVRLDDFIGDPAEQLASLAAWAPGRVSIYLPG